MQIRQSRSAYSLFLFEMIGSLKITIMRGCYFRMIIILMLMIPLISFAQKESPVKFGLRVAPGIGWMRPNTEGYESSGIRAVISAGLISDFYFVKLVPVAGLEPARLLKAEGF